VRTPVLRSGCRDVADIRVTWSRSQRAKKLMDIDLSRVEISKSIEGVQDESATWQTTWP
jgi:hypothetical protein